MKPSKIIKYRPARQRVPAKIYKKPLPYKQYKHNINHSPCFEQHKSRALNLINIYKNINKYAQLVADKGNICHDPHVTARGQTVMHSQRFRTSRFDDTLWMLDGALANSSKNQHDKDEILLLNVAAWVAESSHSHWSVLPSRKSRTTPGRWRSANQSTDKYEL